MKKKKKLIYLAACMVVLGGVVMIYAFAPYSDYQQTCIFCGIWRKKYTICGIQLWSNEVQTGASRWVTSLYPDHKEHKYRFLCATTRHNWFGSVECADGFDYVCSVGRMAMLVGFQQEEKARAYLERWHKTLTMPNEQEAFVLQEQLADELAAAIVQALEQ